MISRRFIQVTSAVSEKSFTIDYEKDTFMKDGKPFRYVSGSFHYSRVPRFYWKDRMLKMRAAGLNALQTYVVWNSHNPAPGVYNWEGQNDLVAFLQMAQEVGLNVLLRGGPYICGEWEYGGFPPWILKNNGSIIPRSMDPGYIQPVDKWLSVFLPKIKPMLYKNGGPVLMVQIENEYGSYFACDQVYMQYLRTTFLKYLGSDTVLYTTDGAGAQFLKCGPTKGVYCTVDFGVSGSSPEPYFKVQRMKEPHGPLVNSEFYTGWLDHWGSPHSTRAAAPIAHYLDLMLNMSANVNMYMFAGGTNFDWYNGADPVFEVCPTSYDYDAPISEAGDTGDKLMIIRNVISKYLPVSDVPPNMPKYAYGNITMKKVGTVYDLLSRVGPVTPVRSQWPLSQEQIDQSYGYTLYRHVATNTYSDKTLAADGMRDRGYVMVDQVPVGILDRNAAVKVITISIKTGQTLDIFVENMGRINFGSDIVKQRKGLISNVTIDGDNLQNWEIYTLDFGRLTQNKLKMNTVHSSTRGEVNDGKQDVPSAYQGTFQCPNKTGFPQDTFLLMYGWVKGNAYMNGYNLGRYWPMKGPQVTLYIPSGFLKPYPEMNTITMVELEKSPCTSTRALDDGCSVKLVDTPILNGTATGDPHGELIAMKLRDPYHIKHDTDWL